MTYRNKLRKAAIFILQKVCRDPAVVIKKIVGVEANLEKFPWIELKEIKSRKFPRKILREAVEFLFAAKEIDMLDNQIDRFDIKIKCTSKGRSALLERKCQDDISDYRNEKWSKALGWRVGVGGLLLGLVSFLYAIAKDSEVRNLRIKLENAQHPIQAPHQPSK